jgi:hypothetical protein
MCSRIAPDPVISDRSCFTTSGSQTGPCRLTGNPHPHSFLCSSCPTSSSLGITASRPFHHFLYFTCRLFFLIPRLWLDCVLAPSCATHPQLLCHFSDPLSTPRCPTDQMVCMTGCPTLPLTYKSSFGLECLSSNTPVARGREVFC